MLGELIPIEDDLLALIYNGGTEERDLVMEQASVDWFISTSGKSLFSSAVQEMESGRQPSWVVAMQTPDKETRDRVATLSSKAPCGLIGAKSVIKAAADYSHRMQVASACATAERELGEGDNPLEVAGRLENKLRELSCDGDTETITLGHAAERLINDSERASRRKVMFSGIPSGLAGVDVLTGGFRAGQMVVLAARTGEGKTSLATQMLLHAARNKWDDARDDWAQRGHVVCMVELEMTASEVAQRAVAHLGGPPLWKLRDAGKLNEQDIKDSKLALQVLHNIPFYVDAPPRIRMATLRAKARMWKKRHGMEILCVDLIGKVGGEGRERERWREVAVISHSLKALAKELDCVVIAVAQLSRDAAGGDGEAGIHQIRESGDIEQDADIVMLLTTNPKDSTIKQIRVAKNRSGLTGRVGLRFNGDTQRFSELVQEAK